MNEYVTILDFETKRVHQYKVETENAYDGYEYEDFIADKGHNLANCQWMVHEEPEVITTEVKSKEDLLSNAIAECVQMDIDRGVEPSLD